MNHVQESNGEHRRSFLRKSAIAAGAAWVAPVVISQQAAVAQTSGEFLVAVLDVFQGTGGGTTCGQLLFTAMQVNQDSTVNVTVEFTPDPGGQIEIQSLSQDGPPTSIDTVLPATFGAVTVINAVFPPSATSWLVSVTYRCL